MLWYLIVEELFVVFICLVLNALLASFEMAFVSINKSFLLQEMRKGSSIAALILKEREKPERILSVIQVGITLVGAISATVSGAAAQESLTPLLMAEGYSEAWADTITVLAVVAPLAYLSVVIGELVPKTLALRYSFPIIKIFMPLISFLNIIFSPIIWVLEKSTLVVLQFFPEKKNESQLEGFGDIELESLSKHHKQYILNLANIETKRAQDIMIIWKDVHSISATNSSEEVLQLVVQYAHTRLPVIEAQSVIGILHTKEFVAYHLSGAQNWTSIVRPVLRIPFNESALNVLRLMQSKKSHMALVMGKNAEVLGIVTLEDINEEIWGDIYDEDDDGRMKKLLASRSKLGLKPNTN
ncbi:MAG: hemolysin family protein [Proteobacteria bacterium]|nr:hemolysin family protein [Pseudomonadota bacterium]